MAEDYLGKPLVEIINGRMQSLTNKTAETISEIFNNGTLAQVQKYEEELLKLNESHRGKIGKLEVTASENENAEVNVASSRKKLNYEKATCLMDKGLTNDQIKKMYPTAGGRSIHAYRNAYNKTH